MAGYPSVTIDGSLSCVQQRRMPSETESLALRLVRTVIRAIQASGVSTLVGIARELQARGVRTPAGHNQWQPVQASRLLAV